MLNTGELYIENVEPKDALKTYRCQVKHRLTNEKILSSTSGRLFVSGKHNRESERNKKRPKVYIIFFFWLAGKCLTFYLFILIIFLTEVLTNQSPRIIDSKSSLIVEEGRWLEIGCLAQGYPQPSYNWYHNSQLIDDQYLYQRQRQAWNNYADPQHPIQVLKSSLFIATVVPNDAGHYRCVVNNSLGSEIAETQVIVKCKC